MVSTSQPSQPGSGPTLDPDSPMRDMGPIDYIVIEFAHRRFATGNGFSLLLDLVNNGTIRILDLAFIRKEQDGSVVRLQPSDLAAEGQPEIMVFDGAASDLLDQGDIDATAAVIEPDSTAAILIYENSWAAPFATEMNRQGGKLIANGRIPVQALVAALDAADAADAEGAQKS